MSVEKNKLFIGNLDGRIKWFHLKEFFNQYGEVMYTKVVADRETKRSRGFGFILFATNEDAATALEKANGAIIQLPGEEFAPREIRLMYAEAKEESENSNSGHDNQENNSESDDVISSQNDDDSEGKDEDESDEE